MLLLPFYSITVSLLLSFLVASCLGDAVLIRNAEASSRHLSSSIACPDEIVAAIATNNENNTLQELLVDTGDMLRDCELSFDSICGGSEVAGTALHYAVDLGYAEVVDVLIGQNFDVNAGLTTGAGFLSVGSVPLMVATVCGHAEVARSLLENPQTEVNIRNQDNNTALKLSVDSYQYEILKLLLAAPGLDVNVKNQDGHSVLFTAVQYGYTEVARMIIPIEGADLNEQGEDGATILHWSILYGDGTTAALILEQPSVDCTIRDEEGTTALISASKFGLIEVVNLLVAFSDNTLNAQNKFGETALSSAARNTQTQILEVLAGAQDEDTITGLMFAAARNHYQAVGESVVMETVNCNQKNKDGTTALMLAVERGNQEATQALLSEPRVDVNLQSDEGMSALMLAAKKDYRKVTQELLNHEDIDVTLTNEGVNALVLAADNSAESAWAFLNNTWNGNLEEDVFTGYLLAAQSGHKQAFSVLLQMLRQLGIAMTSLDEGGNNALMVAASAGQLEIALMLLTEASWDLHHRNEANQSALRLAIVAGYYFITKLLLDEGATLNADIDDSDVEGRRLAVWMGVEFSEERLVKPFVIAAGHGGDNSTNWAALWQETTACAGSLKDGCTGSLMTHAATATIIHLLLDWQFRYEKKHAPSIDEEKLANFEIGLTSESKEVIDITLATALASENSQAALALLSRGAWKDEAAALSDQSTLWDVSLASQDSGETVVLRETKRWNRLHWGAFSCDVSAMNLALKFSTKAIVEFLDSEPTEGETRTPFEIAEGNAEDCVRTYALFEELQETWNRQFAYRLIAGWFTAFACFGALALQLLFVRMQTLKKLGWLMMGSVPLVLLSTGLFLVLTPPTPTEGILSVTSKALQRAVGWAGVTAGALLLPAVAAVFMSRRLTQWLQGVKKRGNEKLDRFWEKLNCILACILTVILIIEAILIQQMGLGFKVVAPLAGLAHTAATALPLCVSHPKRSVLALRLVPGVCFIGLILYAYLDEDTRLLEIVPPEAFVLIATLLALTIADLGGTALLAIRRAKGVLTKAKTLIEQELTKEDGESRSRFMAHQLILARAAISAQGIEAALGLTSALISEGLRDPIAAMRQEIEATGDEDDLENFTYIVEGVSGRASDLPSAVAKSLETGVYHGGTIGPNDFDTGHDGRTLDDWMEVSEVALAELTKAEFVAVRFYTSSSFPKINGPLRKKVRPHPWAMVVYLLDRGIKKLRAVQAQVNPQAFAGETTLWRGMKNVTVDLKTFAEFGGTEMAPMSTTTNEDVARHYAVSKTPLVFKYTVGGLKTGVSIQFLSLYPKEEEFLYAPLTFLTLKSRYEDDGTTILVVEPVMS